MEHGFEIRRTLGFLTSLIYILSDRHIVKALLKFWDSKYQGWGMILPRKQLGTKFLHLLGLKNNLKLACLDRDWISLNYLYEIFGRKDGHKVFSREFSCSTESWRKKRHIAFAIALLGILVFPLEHGRIDTFLSFVVRDLFRGVENAKVIHWFR